MTYLTKIQTLTLVWWLLSFRVWKVEAMKHFEHLGMADVFAYKKAKSLSKKEWNNLK